MFPLVLLKEGETAEVVVRNGRDGTSQTYGLLPVKNRCGGNCARCLCRDNERHSFNNKDLHIEAIGIGPGKIVEMINNSGAGPLLLRVDESRIALGRGEALKIFVRRVVA